MKFNHKTDVGLFSENDILKEDIKIFILTQNHVNLNNSPKRQRKQKIFYLRFLLKQDTQFNNSLDLFISCSTHVDKIISS